jgi:hypothetical protein
MEAYLKAGVFFHDTVVRYTEISESADGLVELKRLGSCRFDFSVIEALTSGDRELIETLREALTEVFGDSTPVEVCAAIDPNVCITFQTSIQADASDEQMRTQVLAEMAVLADPDTPLHVSSDENGSVLSPDGVEISHLQVLAFPDKIRENLDRVLANIPGDKHYFSAVQGAGRLLQQFVGSDDSSSGFDVAFGQYKDHFEYAVCRSGRLEHVQHIPCENTLDGIYHGARLLRLLGSGTAELNRIFLYGEELSESVVERYDSLLGRTELLDPLRVVKAAGSPKSSFDNQSFVQCVGVALSPAN